jgi:tRNA(fMet)-specific endonuclease VapC
MLDRAEWVGVPVIVIGELCAGFAKGSRFEKNLRELDEFLALPVVMINELRRSGRSIPVNDVWIAAPCVRASATLLRWDAHFGRFRGWERWCSLGRAERPVAGLVRRFRLLIVEKRFRVAAEGQVFASITGSPTRAKGSPY